MKNLTSTRFRLSFLELQEATQVTVHGRVVGTWTPLGTAESRPTFEAPSIPVTADRVSQPVAAPLVEAPRKTSPDIWGPPTGFGASRPAPKPGKK